MKHNPIVEQCQGCHKVKDGVCVVYYLPTAKWKNGNCPLASHAVIEDKNVEKRRVGQQKQKRKK